MKPAAYIYDPVTIARRSLEFGKRFAVGAFHSHIEDGIENDDNENDYTIAKEMSRIEMNRQSGASGSSENSNHDFYR